MTTDSFVIPTRRTRRWTVVGIVASWFASLAGRSAWFEAATSPLVRAVVTIVALLLLFWLASRNYRAARRIADDTDAALDERQLALRNRTYLEAYRIVSAVAVLWAIYLSLAADTSTLWFPRDPFAWTIAAEGILLLSLLAPSVQLTWREPDDETEGRP